MTLLLLVRRSLRQHLLSTLITAASLALAGGLLMSVWVVKEQALETFTQVTGGFDAVLGARGSRLQLVLNSIFHLEASPGNVPYAEYQAIKAHPAVKRAIPIATGDNFQGYRVVGTEPGMFTDVEYAEGRKYAFSDGGIFNRDEEEAVVGSFAAERLRLKVGDTFHPYHGLSFSEESQHSETYRVVGVLASSNTPADKVIWIPLHGVQTMTGHDPRAATDVSAVLIQLSSPVAGFALDLRYNKQGTQYTFAFPVGAVVADLFDKINWFDRVLELVAYLVALVSAAGVLVAIYNSMAARQRDIAILRSLGAHRRTILGAVVLEAAAIGTLGMIASFAVYAAILTVVTSIVREQTGITFDTWAFNRIMLAAPLAMIGLCALGGIVPAWKAYRTDIAENLAPVS